MAEPITKSPKPSGPLPKEPASLKLPMMKPVASHKQIVSGPTPNPDKEWERSQRATTRDQKFAGMRRLRERALD